MHWPERGQIYFYASSPDNAAWMFAYLANMAVLCYSWTIICCYQVQNHIYCIISTENDHRHHHNFMKYEKYWEKKATCPFYLSNKIFATSGWVWTRSTSFSSFQMIPYIYSAFVPFERYCTFSSTCCVLFLDSAHAPDGFT